MPIMRCIKDGRSGYKAGPTGKCYYGEGAKERAEMQLRAIEASKSTKKGGK